MMIAGRFGDLEIVFMFFLRRKLVNAHFLHSSGENCSDVCPVGVKEQKQTLEGFYNTDFIEL